MHITMIYYTLRSRIYIYIYCASVCYPFDGLSHPYTFPKCYYIYIIYVCARDIHQYMEQYLCATVCQSAKLRECIANVCQAILPCRRQRRPFTINKTKGTSKRRCCTISSSFQLHFEIDTEWAILKNGLNIADDIIKNKTQRPYNIIIWLDDVPSMIIHLSMGSFQHTCYSYIYIYIYIHYCIVEKHIYSITSNVVAKHIFAVCL